MNLKIFAIASLLIFSVMANGQTETDLNKTDQQGRKQGPWIKKYLNGTFQYEGFFKDDHPVGEFKRYYETKILKSVLLYSEDGKEAIATIYHPNGYISSKGKYLNQMKEGKWQFFSERINGYLISEEDYSMNAKNGLSLKFYADSTIAERVSYVNDIKQGEWIQYFPDGKMSLKSSFLNGKKNGRFEVWFENGKIQFSGHYINDVKNGQWLIYNSDGTLKYKLNYVDGATNDRQMDIGESDYLDLLEKNKGKIADPEITGTIR